MLQKLRGKHHSVITGFTLVDTKSGKQITKSEETRISMRFFTDREIEQYLVNENVLDKAGAYAIQGVGTIFIEKIEGDYFNVVGLPLFAVARELRKLGITVL